jgi:hypothetical protein
MNDQIFFDENAVCDLCGRFGAWQFDQRMLCADCYQNQCSCCPEFGEEEEANTAGEESKPRDPSRAN